MKPLAERIAASPDAALIAKVRAQYGGALVSARVGKAFQEELEDTHKVLLAMDQGAVYPHARETVGAYNPKDPGKALKYKRGGNPVDYTGHVNLEWRVTTGWAPAAHARRQVSGVVFYRVPVVFDAKRMSSGYTYDHNPDMIHQVVQLRDAARNGAAAFLLVHCVPMKCAYMIGPDHFATLLMRKSVKLAETVRGVGSKLSRVSLHPSCEYEPGRGWPWPKLIPLACRDALPSMV